MEIHIYMFSFKSIASTVLILLNFYVVFQKVVSLYESDVDCLFYF